MADDLQRLLARVLCDKQHHGVVVALQGHNEKRDDTPGRVDVAKGFCLPWCLAHGNNTLEEARWAVSLAKPHLTIVTSDHHQLRAFLTFLQVAFDAGVGRTVKLWNAPYFGSAVRGLARRGEELQKIERYQQVGHVASFKEGVDYLDWRD